MTIRFAQPAGKNPLQYAEELVAKTHGCGDVFEEFVLNEIFIEGFYSSVRQSMRVYWGVKKGKILQHIAFHVTLLLKLQERDIWFKSTQPAPTGSNRTVHDEESGSTLKVNTGKLQIGRT